MYCRKCGKTIPDDSVFCPYCGETVTIDAESVEPKEKDHGYCSDCGAPLPPGKLTGLCDACINKAGMENAEYGRCENCGTPLEADDQGTLCKKCTKQRLEEYSPDPLKDEYQNSEVPVKKRSHKGAVAGGIIVSVFAIIVLAAIGNSKTDATQAAAQGSQAAAGSSSAIVAAAVPTVSSAAPDSSEMSDLELLSDNGTYDSSINTIHITGKIKNNSGKTLSYVQVQFALYDKSGSQVGTALANTNGLEPGNTWSYDAIGMAANVSTFKPINLSSY